MNYGFQERRHSEPAVWVSEELVPGTRHYVPHCTMHDDCRTELAQSLRKGGRLKEGQVILDRVARLLNL